MAVVNTCIVRYWTQFLVHSLLRFFFDFKFDFYPLKFCAANTDVDSRLGGQMFPRCTEECRVHGHSDLCWMPETKQRPSSRMTAPLQTGAEGEL